MMPQGTAVSALQQRENIEDRVMVGDDGSRILNADRRIRIGGVCDGKPATASSLYGQQLAKNALRNDTRPTNVPQLFTEVY